MIFTLHVWAYKDEKTLKKYCRCQFFSFCIEVEDLDKVLNFFFSMGLKELQSSPNLWEKRQFFLLKDSRGNSSHGQMIHTELFLYVVSPIFTT